MADILLGIEKDPTGLRPENWERNAFKAMSWQSRTHSHVWSPPTDLYETEDKFVVRVEIAGLRDQDFSVNLDNNYLVISGSRPDILERRAYHQMEIRFGEFNAVIAIPGPVDQEKTSAEYSDGFLIVVMPKLQK